MQKTKKQQYTGVVVEIIDWFTSHYPKLIPKGQ